MKSISLRIFLILLITIWGVDTFAQVTIGSLSDPEKGAALDIKTKESNPNPGNRVAGDLENSDKGFLFPKVMLQKYNELTPLYGDPDNSTEIEKLKATGMVVYNVNPSAENIGEGLHEWSGSEWRSLLEGSSLAAISSMDCGDIELKGLYVKGKPLSSLNNTLSIPFYVQKKGAYNIVAEVLLGDGSNNGNGYSFSASGEFHSTGLTTLVLFAQGTPQLANKEVLNKALDMIKVTVNGSPISCTGGSLPLIFVDEVTPEYTVKCNSITVNTNFKIGVPTTDADVITVRLTSNAIGSQYHLYTDEINGVKFEGQGVIQGGTQTITLYPVGTPENGGEYTYTLYTNSSLNSVACSFDVQVYFKAMKIKIHSNDTGNIGWTMYDPRCAVPMMSQNADIFGLGTNPNAKCLVQSISYTGTSANNTTNFDDFDIVFVSYPVNPNAAMITALVDYAKNMKGTVVYGADGGHRAAMISFLDQLTPGHTIGVSATGNGDTFIPFVAGNSAVNGTYKNITGKTLGRDGGDNWNFTNLQNNPEWVVVAGTASAARVIMHKTYRVFLAGDGGIWTGGNMDDWSDSRPSKVDSAGNPVPATHGIYASGEAYNSFFLANVLIWGFEFKGSQ